MLLDVKFESAKTLGIYINENFPSKSLLSASQQSDDRSADARRRCRQPARRLQQGHANNAKSLVIRFPATSASRSSTVSASLQSVERFHLIQRPHREA